MPGRTVVVTDSTASLPPEAAAEHGVVVVPLQVVIGAEVHDEGGGGATPEMVAAALKSFTPVSTSRPSPAVMAEVYERVAADGATEIVSVHISGDMSGTFESAQLAARSAPVPVVAVDSRQVGVATGYAALAAAEVAAAGGTAEDAAAAARARAEVSSSLFYVDTLEYLRRGGRIGAAAALLGGALAVKPLLTIAEGRVESLERVRTSQRAISRLEELAVEAAGDRPVDVCVAHLASADRAAALTGRLADRLGEQLEGREVWCGELGAVLGAHVGPGMLAVCVAPRLF
ncbi:DegV family EDD domain-containing protein [Nocardioides sp. zg-579]|uniref:DegV family EDD domain-containing protein n=1 Tax=Nocardioides marmotae TaxID=2663857 RepID=A0A6I3JB83_9ACTN|nr:DegV family protein [Nocardioides marmotae]MCR6031731.1 DegV family EDD domain-containing protein [Gordonia jinghuaiqii]MTB95370.1 DegV family EDD domain-containing protein [Nocardioides marmotae]QKE02172.1 DegV family EDD domain-containing protein [Nocardioides marmotae]